MNVLIQYQCVGQTLTVTITMEASHAFVGVDIMSVMEIQLLVKATLALVSFCLYDILHQFESHFQLLVIANCTNIFILSLFCRSGSR